MQGNYWQRVARYMQTLGYTHMHSVVSQYKATTYHNINNVVDVIKNGWSPALKCGGRARGTTTTQLYGDKIAGNRYIARRRARELYEARKKA